MFGRPPQSVASAFAHTQQFPASFRPSAQSMRVCMSLQRRVEPLSQHAQRLCLSQQISHHRKGLNCTCMASFTGRNADSDLAGGGSSIPQPQARNAGASSTNTSDTAPAVPKSNGSNSGSQDSRVSQQYQGAADISELRTEVSKLSELVANQARLLHEQMKDLEHARSLIDMHAMTNTHSASAPTQTIKAGWNKDVKPFEVQRNAIGDRRYLGGYDARFHSTNK